jgi:hypothetical protein
MLCSLIALSPEGLFCPIGAGRAAGDPTRLDRAAKADGHNSQGLESNFMRYSE